MIKISLYVLTLSPKWEKHFRNIKIYKNNKKYNCMYTYLYHEEATRKFELRALYNRYNIFLLQCIHAALKFLIISYYMYVGSLTSQIYNIFTDFTRKSAIFSYQGSLELSWISIFFFKTESVFAINNFTERSGLSSM